MKNKYLGYAFGAALGISIALAPELGEAFYVSQKEAEKAGIKTSEITKTKLPMGDKVSYKGHLEGSETFDDIAKRVHEWAEDFFGTNLSYKTTRKALADFNSYRKIEMPSVSVPCKYQLMVNYVRELEKEMIEQRGKPGPMEKDLEFLKGKLQELEELYEQDIAELREKYTAHEKRIEELEKRPGQKDYSGEIDELWKENEELREMLEGMEGVYAQPPAVEGYGSYGGIIFGQPGWFPGIPYPYGMLNGSIYYWNGFDWMYWGIFEGYGHGFRGRRWDGRIFDYYGPRDLPLLKGRMDHRGLPDGKHWERGGKGFGPHDRDHERGHRPDSRDHRLDRKPGNGKGLDPRGRGQQPSRDDSWRNRGFQKGEAPKIHEDGRNRTIGRRDIPRQEYKGTFPQGGNLQGAPRPNQQLNQGRMEYRGPQGFPKDGNFQNFQGRGLNVQPRNFGGNQRSNNFGNQLPQNRNPKHRGR